MAKSMLALWGMWGDGSVARAFVCESEDQRLDPQLCNPQYGKGEMGTPWSELASETTISESSGFN